VQFLDGTGGDGERGRRRERADLAGERKWRTGIDGVGAR